MNHWDLCKQQCIDIIRKNTPDWKGYQVESIVEKINNLESPQCTGGIRHRYEDIYLRPRFSAHRTRKYISTKMTFLDDIEFKLPIIPANMTSVINAELAIWMALNGYFYIMHRFGDTRDFIRKLLEASRECKLISISVGVKQDDIDLIRELSNLSIHCITIDIAHGHCLSMQEMIRTIRDISPKSFIIAGNVSTAEAVRDLEAWGANAVKVGIAQGGACTTFGKTGFGGSMFSCIQECAAAANIPIIADGGIKTNGDIPKALVAGATAVMCGALFAACIDSPAEFSGEMKSCKRYFGSASTANKKDWRHIEGQIIDIPCNHMTYEQKLKELEADLQSAMSYGGCQTLRDFRKVDWDVVY